MSEIIDRNGFQNIVYYSGREQSQRPNVSRPLNVVFLTSIRDTGTCDRNGTMVETGNGLRYMEGAIERTVKETHPFWRGASGLTYAGALAGLIRVVGVITDDTEHDMRNSDYSSLPILGKAWIYPFELSTPEGRLLREKTYNIPSSFRLLPLNALEERRQLKYEFEWAVLQIARELGGDVIISDHYMARLDFLTEEFGMYGRVLNIHPAVTVKYHPFCLRGKTPTADAIDRARSGVLTTTGATLHFINGIIDDGPPIAYIANTPVFPTDEPQWLRYRNYTLGKLPLFTHGLAHYARVLYPYLDELDLSRLTPIPTPEDLTGNADTRQLSAGIY